MTMTVDDIKFHRENDIYYILICYDNNNKIVVSIDTTVVKNHNFSIDYQNDYLRKNKKLKFTEVSTVYGIQNDVPYFYVALRRSNHTPYILSEFDLKKTKSFSAPNVAISRVSSEEIPDEFNFS